MSQRTETALDGRYPLDFRIAIGGMGEVWRGTDVVLDRPVAVKILRREYADDPTFADRFRAEAHSMAALRHPGIAAVHDCGEARLGDATVPYIVMELVPGEPLSAIIERSGPLEVDRALDLVAQAASALQAAHEAGVVHRDVKPANLLVTPDGTVKVTDFGIARAADALPLTRTGTVMGTAHYLAPEMASRQGAASARSDVYALGVVLYECLTGRRPFPGDNPVAVALAHLHEQPPPLPDWIPEPVRRLVALAMTKDPQARLDSAAELARQIAAVRHAGALAEPVALGAAPAGSGPEPAAVPAPAALSPAVSADVSAVVPDPPPAPIRRHGRARRHQRRPEPRPSLQPAPRSAPGPGRERGAGLLMAAGAALLALSAAWLILSMGPGSAVVPDVTRMREAQARARLAALGFPLEIRREVNRKVSSGVVYQQRPVPGTESSIRSPVLIVVSAGPPRFRVVDANWRGRPYDEVAAELRRRGLAVTPHVVTRDEAHEVVPEGVPLGPAGTVADISPDGEVRAGDSVTVTVIETLGRNE